MENGRQATVVKTVGKASFKSGAQSEMEKQTDFPHVL